MFIIMKLIVESTLIIINDTRSKIFGNAIFERKGVTLRGLIFKCLLQFTTIKDVFLKNFFNLFPTCKDIELRYEKTRTKVFFSTVISVVYVIQKFFEILIYNTSSVAFFKGNLSISGSIYKRVCKQYQICKLIRCVWIPLKFGLR